MPSARNRIAPLPQIKSVLVHRLEVKEAAHECSGTPFASSPFARCNDGDSMDSNDTGSFCRVSALVHMVSNIEQQIRQFTALRIRVDRLQRALETNLGNLTKLGNNIYRLVYEIDEMNGQLLED